MSSLSAHLVDSYDHQRALHRHRLQNPETHRGRQPFTPQYIITEETPSEPIFDPPVNAQFGASHGKPVRGWTGSLHTIAKIDQDELEQRNISKPPITQKIALTNDMSNTHINNHSHNRPNQSPTAQMKQEPPSTPLLPITQWDLSGSSAPQYPAHTPSHQPHQPTPAPSGTMGISEYTAGQISTLQSRLGKKLGPEYINHRPGPGGGPQLR